MKIAIVGAGAAGCFCAIHVKRLIPSADVVVYEAANRPLAKVAITGGGRCNLTNSFRQVRDLAHVYPRGERLMKKLFSQWNHADTMQWFQQEGVPLVTQTDECVFPQSQDAMDIVRTLLYIMRGLGIDVRTGHPVQRVEPLADGYRLHFRHDIHPATDCDKVVLTIGGCPTMRQLAIFESLQVDVVTPVPSLFTFNIDDRALHELMGCVVERAQVSLAGTKFRADGPLLITHWGVSGPAILKLSSYSARYLAEHDYKASLCINWMTGDAEEDVRQRLAAMASNNRQRLVANEYPSHLTSRLWQFLLQRSHVPAEMKWCDLSGKRLNKLVSVLTADTYPIVGKCKFKEEFVTCGGIALSSLRGTSMELRHHPGVYVAGEVADVDAITGGFNLQAAWTMGVAVAREIAKTAS